MFSSVQFCKKTENVEVGVSVHAAHNGLNKDGFDHLTHRPFITKN